MAGWRAATVNHHTRELNVNIQNPRSRIADYDWNPDAVDRLTKLWADGLSGAQIADELGCGRSAVIGKVHRLGLPSRAKAPRPKMERDPMTAKPKDRREEQALTAKRVRAAPTMAYTAPKLAVGPYELTIPPSQRCTLEQLNKKKCKWPVGDVGHPDFFFCGGRASEGEPYCAYHCRIAYTPTASRRAAGGFVSPRSAITGGY